MSNRYDVHADDVIQALIAEAVSDSDVIGLVLTGSRAVGDVTSESDYDAVFVVTNEVMARYEQTQTMPSRGGNISPSIHADDIWHQSLDSLHLDTVERWMLPAWAEACILYDRTGETTRAIDALRRMPEAEVQKAVGSWYDAYLNGLYRSLKAWRRGNELGGRMEAAQTTDYLLHILFALERRWRPYSSRLIFHLDKLDAQGWAVGELNEILLDLISTGNPHRQQLLARRVVALLHERSFGHIYDAWDGQIDQALSWTFVE